MVGLVKQKKSRLGTTFNVDPRESPGVMMNYQPKQGTIKGKSLKPTIHLHFLIPHSL